MFNTVLPYRFVQRDRNRTGGQASWEWRDLYRFHIRTALGIRKYLVEVHAYPNHLYTVDFFAKAFSNSKYRLQTNQFAANKVGGTMLDLLARIQQADPEACFGFIGAAMVGENESQGTRRFWFYLRMLRKLT